MEIIYVKQHKQDSEKLMYHGFFHTCNLDFKKKERHENRKGLFEKWKGTRKEGAGVRE